MLRAEFTALLLPYSYREIDHARDVLGDSTAKTLSDREILSLWDRISSCLDHHASELNPLPVLQQLEKTLAEQATYKVVAS
jgi:hypothetical protein